MLIKRKLFNSVKIWKWIIERDVRIYPDGLYRLKGLLGNSVTFGFIKAPKKKIQNITEPNGKLKPKYLKKLAEFMNRRSPDPYLTNSELIVLGLANLLDSEHFKNLSPNISLRFSSGTPITLAQIGKKIATRKWN